MVLPFRRLRCIDGGRKGPSIRFRRRSYGMVRRFNEAGEAVYLTAIMTAPTLYGGNGCA